MRVTGHKQLIKHKRQSTTAHSKKIKRYSKEAKQNKGRYLEKQVKI